MGCGSSQSMHSTAQYTQVGGHTGTRKGKWGNVKAEGEKFSLGSGGRDGDLCNDKKLNIRRGQVKTFGLHGSVNIEGNFLYILGWGGGTSEMNFFL